MAAVLALAERPTLGVVDQTIGAQIARRRTRLGMSVKALADAAGVDRGSISKIERAGIGRDSTVGAISAALDKLEHEMGLDLPVTAVSEVPAEGLVEFSIPVHGMDAAVVVKGPVGNLAELEAAVGRLVDRMRAERDAEGKD